ncbi:uncharacterized protein HaLaN_24194 [Haematococcus lacustris]|uniref:Uncharacterized protein n=1 Tax=Haematococcus lacustris TaxID=44745 RepID=A0A6A0A2K4_HAELA|nr:uncharacterized protein HaLaN_24194 [Haematococcus lacustris]
MAEEKRAVPYSRGKALADEYRIQFFETSAKENVNVEEVFTAIALDVMKRLQAEQQLNNPVTEQPPLQLTTDLQQPQHKPSSGCC